MQKIVSLVGLGLGLCACAPLASEGIGAMMQDAGTALADAGSWVSDAGTAQAQTREIIEAPCDARYEWVERWDDMEHRTAAQLAYLPGSEGATEQDLLRVSVILCGWSASPAPAQCSEGATCSGTKPPQAACTAASAQIMDGRIGVQCWQEITSTVGTFQSGWSRAIFERR